MYLKEALPLVKLLPPRMDFQPLQSKGCIFLSAIHLYPLLFTRQVPLENY
jgi:hypothetical protein